MANAAVDQALVDQLAEAFSVTNTKVTILVTDTTVKFESTQDDSPSGTLKNQIVIKTADRPLMTAIVAAIQSTGRP